MKYFKTLELYKASNVTFNPLTVEATSYDWWVFVKVIDDKIVFNEYRYSNTTAKHQFKVRVLMAQLGIVPNVIVNVKQSLEHVTNLKSLIKDSEDQIEARLLAKKVKQRESRYFRKLMEMHNQGYRHKDGSPINPHLEAMQLANK